MVFFTQGLPDRQNGRVWARWIANCLSYTMSPFTCVLAVRKVFFLNIWGDEKGLEIKGRLISNEMYVK